MMLFVIMTLSFTVSILLAMVVACVLMTQPKVIKWYMKFMFKTMNNMNKVTEDLIVEDL